MKKIARISETLTGLFKASSGKYSYQISSYIDSNSYITISGTLYTEDKPYPSRLIIDYDTEHVTLECYSTDLQISEEDITKIASEALGLIREDKDITKYSATLDVKK